MMSTNSKIAVIAIIALSHIISCTTTNIHEEVLNSDYIETFKDIRQKVISDVENGTIPLFQSLLPKTEKLSGRRRLDGLTKLRSKPLLQRQFTLLLH